jgi:hypothetical protein
MGPAPDGDFRVGPDHVRSSPADNQGMNTLVILFGVPAGAIALSGLGLHYVQTPWVRRISTAAISTQIVLTGAAWALFESLPREIDWSGAVGDTCPRTAGVQGGVITVIALVSVGVAAVALASGVIVVRRRAGSAWRILGGIGAAVLVVAIFAGMLGAALCGMN